MASWTTITSGLQPIKYSLNISILYRGVSPSPLWPFIFIVTALTSFRLTTFLKSGIYRGHDMFSRIFCIRISNIVHQYFSVEKKNLFRQIWSVFEHFRESKQILHNTYFVDSYLKNSWKHVVSLTFDSDLGLRLAAVPRDPPDTFLSLCPLFMLTGLDKV